MSNIFVLIFVTSIIWKYTNILFIFIVVLLIAGKKRWWEGSRFRDSTSPFCSEDGIEVGYNIGYACKLC